MASTVVSNLAKIKAVLSSLAKIKGKLLTQLDKENGVDEQETLRLVCDLRQLPITVRLLEVSEIAKVIQGLRRKINKQGVLAKPLKDLLRFWGSIVDLAQNNQSGQEGHGAQGALEAACPAEQFASVTPTQNTQWRESYTASDKPASVLSQRQTSTFNGGRKTTTLSASSDRLSTKILDQVLLPVKPGHFPTRTVSSAGKGSTRPLALQTSNRQPSSHTTQSCIQSCISQCTNHTSGTSHKQRKVTPTSGQNENSRDRMCGGMSSGRPDSNDAHLPRRSTNGTLVETYGINSPSNPKKTSDINAAGHKRARSGSASSAETRKRARKDACSLPLDIKGSRKAVSGMKKKSKKETSRRVDETPGVSMGSSVQPLSSSLDAISPCHQKSRSDLSSQTPSRSAQKHLQQRLKTTEQMIQDLNIQVSSAFRIRQTDRIDKKGVKPAGFMDCSEPLFKDKPMGASRPLPLVPKLPPESFSDSSSESDD